MMGGHALDRDCCGGALVEGGRAEVIFELAGPSVDVFFFLLLW